MNSRTLLLAATALTLAPLARADDSASVNDLTAKVLAILNSPAGKEELSKQLQALAAALKANGQGDLTDALTKLEAQLQAANGNADTALPEPAAEGAAAAPTHAPAKAARATRATGLQGSHLQTSSIQSAAQGLTSAEEWRRMFPPK